MFFILVDCLEPEQDVFYFQVRRRIGVQNPNGIASYPRSAKLVGDVLANRIERFVAQDDQIRSRFENKISYFYGNFGDGDAMVSQVAGQLIDRLGIRMENQNFHVWEIEFSGIRKGDLKETGRPRNGKTAC